MERRRFEYTEGNSSKYWIIWTQDNQYFVHYGRIGSAGQTTVKVWASAYTAEYQARKIIQEKISKGYREVTERSTPTRTAAPMAKPTPKPAPKVEPKVEAKPVLPDNDLKPEGEIQEVFQVVRPRALRK
jgi:predicted DNA-binding WGR domain protein